MTGTSTKTRLRTMSIVLTLLLAMGMLLSLPAAGAGTSASSARGRATIRAFEQHKAALLDGMNVYFGNLHSHTAFSGGQGTPAEALTWARDTAGFDFYAITDHAEFITDAQWAEIGQNTDEFNQDGSFVALRGFEWSNLYFGHSCVYNTANYTNSLATPIMKCFYEWLVANNGYAQFNHPGREPGLFSCFKYSSDSFGSRMLAIETGNKEVGNNDGEYLARYPQALDKGWRLSPTNNQDNHELSTYSNRTAVVGPALTRTSILDSMLARRTYSTDDPNMRVVFKYGTSWMGSEVERDVGPAGFSVLVEDDEEISRLELITTGGAVAAQTDFAPGSGSTRVTWEPVVPVTGNAYYYLKVTERDTNNDDDLSSGTQVAVTAPIWFNLPMANGVAPAGTWYRGDLHSHSTYSDGDSSVATVVSVAESKGLDFFGLTDHDTVDQWADPGFHSDKLTLLNGVEWTTDKGHANIWSDKLFDWSRISPTLASGDAKTAIETTHLLAAEGGQKILFSMNHPNGFACQWMNSFEDSKEADCMEVWNSRFAWPNLNFLTLQQQLDSYLKQGKHITMVGGSDCHCHIFGDITKPLSFFESLYNDIGVPTTWVYAKSKGATDILDGMLDGHVSISFKPSGPQVQLMADPSFREGEPETYEVMMGDAIPDRALGRRVRFRAQVSGAGVALPSMLSVWKNGSPILVNIGNTSDYSYDFVDVPRKGDYYRVQLNQIDSDSAENPVMQFLQLTQLGWVSALSNPIYTWGAGPAVASIDPASGINNGQVKVTDLAGAGFQKGAAVELRKSGQPAITASDVSVESPAKITCALGLPGAAPGQWDVVVINPNSRTGVKVGGFTVEQAWKATRPLKRSPAVNKARPVTSRRRGTAPGKK